MLSQNLTHNALSTGRMPHYGITAKSAKKSGEIRPQSAFWTDSPALFRQRTDPPSLWRSGERAGVVPAKNLGGSAAKCSGGW